MGPIFSCYANRIHVRLWDAGSLITDNRTVFTRSTLARLLALAMGLYCHHSSFVDGRALLTAPVTVDDRRYTATPPLRPIDPCLILAVWTVAAHFRHQSDVPYIGIMHSALYQYTHCAHIFEQPIVVGLCCHHLATTVHGCEQSTDVCHLLTTLSIQLYVQRIGRLGVTRVAWSTAALAETYYIKSWNNLCTFTRKFRPNFSSVVTKSFH